MVNFNNKSEGNNPREKIKIGDLATLADVSKSTIHHYLKIGILHPPIKISVKRSDFDSSHLIRLNRIRELRQKDRLPLSKIKLTLSKENALDQDATQKIYNTASMIRDLEKKKKNTKVQKDDIKRNQIIDAAIALFAKIGYEKTTLEAIADSMRIAKSTVYLYFENKEQLFMKCIDRLAFITVPEEEWENIKKETNFLTRIKKRATAFHKVFPNYKGILTMIKASLDSGNQEMSDKAKNALLMMTKPIKKDIRRAIAAGVFKDLNEDIIAHLLLAMGEGLGFRQMLDSQYTDKEVIDVMFDFVGRGILKDPAAVETGQDYSFYSAKVKDVNENEMTLKKLAFNGDQTLPVKIGKASVNIFMNKIQNLTFSKQGSELFVQIKSINEQIDNALVQSDLVLSGVMPLGEFSIELKHVKQIVFNHESILY